MTRLLSSLVVRSHPLWNLPCKHIYTRSFSSISTPLDDDPIYKLDLRVGRILDCIKAPNADALLVESVDIGHVQDGSIVPRQIVSGLARYYQPEQLKNKLVVVVANLKAVNFRGHKSHGMLLCAEKEEQVCLLEPSVECQPGDQITFQDYTKIAPLLVLPPKKKIFEQCAEHLRTNQLGIPCYKGKRMMIASNDNQQKIITCILSDASIR